MDVDAFFDVLDRNLPPDLQSIKPAKFSFEVDEAGGITACFGPVPVALQVGDILKIKVSATQAYTVGLLAMNAAMGPSGICEQIERDLDETEYPV